MAQGNKPEHEQPPKAEFPQSQTFAESALAKAAHRAGDHFAGRDPGDPADDAIELWGRRIGRALGLVGVVGLAIYLFVT